MKISYVVTYRSISVKKLITFSLGSLQSPQQLIKYFKAASYTLFLLLRHQGTVKFGVYLAEPIYKSKHKQHASVPACAISYSYILL